MRVENAFAYKLTSDMATIRTDGLILKGLKIYFEINNWVNTMTSPSKNYFSLVTGYTKYGVDYEVDSFNVLIEMLEPDSATLYFSTDPANTVTGEIVDLVISYQLTQTLLVNGLFQVKIPKDLVQYTENGITPRSAIIHEVARDPVSANL